jgi:hypothetical protein
MPDYLREVAKVESRAGCDRPKGAAHRPPEPLDTHPGHGGIVPDYDELSEWLNEQIKAPTPIPSLYTATFRELSGQDRA